MRIAVLTDVHGNLPALETALAAIDSKGVDLIVHTGDAIGIGPFPAECLERLLSLDNVELLMGNHDEYFAQGLQSGSMSEDELAHQKWVHEQLDSSMRAVLLNWPKQVTRTLWDLTVTFIHYPMTKDGKFLPIMKEPDVDDLEQAFDGYPGELICYGHHHPFSDVEGSRRYVNPGSLGCAPSAVARFCVIDIDQYGWRVDHHSVPYDDRTLYEAFEARKVPEKKLIYGAFFGGRFEC